MSIHHSLAEHWNNELIKMYKLIFISSFVCFSMTATVTWLPDANFNSPIFFEDQRLPCSKQTVVFPERIEGSIKLEDEMKVGGFVLPENGELVIENGGVSFGKGLEESNCTNDKNIHFIDRSTASWNQPEVWISTKFNKATPDAERIPCFNDEVEFPERSHYTVILPEVTQYVRQLKLGDRYVDEEEFEVSRGLDESHQFVLNSDQSTGIKISSKNCLSRSGCPCQDTMLKIDCSAKFCSLPRCIYPIKPFGHCCKICGGVISFNIDKSFNYFLFTELLDRAVNDYGKNSIVYHVGRLPNNKVQVVVVDRDEYKGKSAEFVNAFDYTIKDDYWGLTEKMADISGGPISDSGSGFKIFVSVFFAIVLVLVGIYVYYYKLPGIHYPSGKSSRVWKSRFQRRTESVVSLTRRDSGVAIGSGVGTSFRNPLYDSKRMYVTEKVDEE